MRQKTRGIITMLLCASLTLTGCSNTTGSQKKEVKKEAADKEQTVKLTLWGGAEDQKMLQSMVDDFKKEHASEASFDIKLAVEGETTCKETLLGDVEKGADVFAFPDDQLQALAASGVLQEIRDADQVKQDNIKGAVEAASVNDRLFAYPMTADNGYFLYYNKKYFSGNDVKKLDTILAKAEKVHKKVTMDWTSAWYLYSFFGNTGLKAGVNEDGVTNYCNWNSKKGKIKGIDVAQAMERIAGSSAFLNTTDDKFLKGVQNGSVIAGVSGVWNANAIDKAWGKNYGAVKLPTYTCAGKQVQMASFTGYKMVGVNAYSSDVKWAMKLAEWITNQDNQTRRFAERGQGPSNIKASQSGDIEKSPAIQAVIAQSEYGCLQRVGGNFWDPISSFGSSVANGTLSPKELQKELDDMVKKVTAPTV
ncbi:extracellular solute-binding protein [Jutongia huaianensis]|uniref:Extracellular solute-binding protein n=1 Tax=Jutongia huaianensis TaxID=2763668 RepID=A0ABR7N2M2_9FIRM|nr:extracellular solute-binding protein [Jutongia huaianensis]MBC8562881.1 extracellular solute-binding protein [Jutongia huaianensis]RHU95292.1 extracellular solute-binding protein [Clostridium sp. OM07-9AC]RHV05269.1 extracellular solute-binding protein [Clostridium sp. OM07-10AC]